MAHKEGWRPHATGAKRTQDGQGGHGPQVSQGRTEHWTRVGPWTGGTQDGQGGPGPQVSQGHIGQRRPRPPAPQTKHMEGQDGLLVRLPQVHTGNWPHPTWPGDVSARS